jgi:hypothetical protein
MGSVISSGETEIAVMVGTVTVTRVDPVTAPSVAVTVAVPPATPVTVPEASTEACPIVEELQPTNAVRSRVLPSL